MKQNDLIDKIEKLECELHINIKMLERLEDEVDSLQNNVGIYVNIDPENVLSLPVRFPVNKAVQRILDHFNLKLKYIPSCDKDIELVEKE